MFRFIHTADIHASKRRRDSTLKTLDLIEKQASDFKADCIIIAGDFFDSPMTATEASGFAPILRRMEEVQSHTPVYMLRGTPSHETDGSLDCFRVMPNVTVVETPSVLDMGKGVMALAIPEPRLPNFSGDMQEKYAAIQEMYSNMFAKAMKQYEEEKFTHKILVFHGDMEGGILQNGAAIPSGNATLPLSLVKKFSPDYGCLGHVHRPQQVPGTNCWYPGTPCPKDFGEPHEGIIKLVELD